MTVTTFKPAYVLPYDLAKYARHLSGDGRPPKFERCYAMAQRGWITGRGAVTDPGEKILSMGVVTEVSQQLLEKLAYAKRFGSERSPKLRDLGLLDKDFAITDEGTKVLDTIDKIVAGEVIG